MNYFLEQTINNKPYDDEKKSLRVNYYIQVQDNSKNLVETAYQ